MTFYPEDNPNETVDTSQETDNNSEGIQGAGGQSQEENPPKGVDASKLTPELQELYKNMQADYTRKATELAKERKALQERQEQLDSKITQVVKNTTPKEPDMVDTSQMTADQERAWNQLNKHFDKKIQEARKEERTALKNEFAQLQSQMSEIMWQNWATSKSDATPEMRTRMHEKWQEKGGMNSGLTLNEVYLLVKGEKGLKQAGVEEYKKTVSKQKTKVTTQPSAASGQETGIDFENQKMSWAPGKTKRNLQKAMEKAREAIGMSGK